MITISLAAALLCFAPDDCVPALVGRNTPTGMFAMQQYRTEARGYGGDVVVFHETEKLAFAIHRVWTQRPKERRMERLLSPTVADNRGVTQGCVNVLPEHYDRLVAALAADRTLLIKP